MTFQLTNYFLPTRLLTRASILKNYTGLRNRKAAQANTGGQNSLPDRVLHTHSLPCNTPPAEQPVAVTSKRCTSPNSQWHGGVFEHLEWLGGECCSSPLDLGLALAWHPHHWRWGRARLGDPSFTCKFRFTVFPIVSDGKLSKNCKFLKDCTPVWSPFK